MTEPYGYDDDNPDDVDPDVQDDRHVRLTREQIRTLERDAKNSRKLGDQNAQLVRELALARAGLGDLTPAKQKALLASIDGDITADSARTAAEELGFVQPVAAPVQDADAAALGRMANASNGATDIASEDQIAELERAAAEGGLDALYATMQKHGHVITPAG